MISSSLSPVPSFQFIYSVNMLHPQGTGHPDRGEAMAEAGGSLGSLACRGRTWACFPGPWDLSSQRAWIRALKTSELLT